MTLDQDHSQSLQPLSLSRSFVCDHRDHHRQLNRASRRALCICTRSVPFSFLLMHASSFPLQEALSIMSPIRRIAQISSHLRTTSTRVSTLSRNLTSASSSPAYNITNKDNASSSSAYKITNKDRAFYPYALDIQSRWADNDQYGHLNNAHYYALFDTVINTFLIQETGLNPQDQSKDSAIGVVAESGCQYFSSLSFPDMIEARLAVVKLGRSSVVYQVGIFKKLANRSSATGRPGVSATSAGVYSKAASPVATGMTVSASEFEPSQVQGDAAAIGHFCHVFVNNESRRPVAIPQRIRAGLEQLQVLP